MPDEHGIANPRRTTDTGPPSMLSLGLAAAIGPRYHQLITVSASSPEELEKKLQALEDACRQAGISATRVTSRG